MIQDKSKHLPGQQHEEDEIDLVRLANEAWNERRLIIKTVLIFMFIGLFVAVFAPRKYKVTSIVVPQSSNTDNNLGGLSSLAAMAGFNLNTASGAEINPMIYPKIVQSTPFQVALMKTKLNIKGVDHQITYYEYYTKYYKKNILGYITGIFGYIKKVPEWILQKIHGKKFFAIQGNTTHLIHLTLKERQLTKQLKNNVTVSIDSKNGYIQISAVMPEALAAAQLDEKALQLLQKDVITIRSKKARAQLDFIKGRYNAQKKIYETLQDKLALMTDKNNNVITQADQTKITRMQGDYQTVLSVYTGLANQLEKARIQVKNDTPVFSIIQPATIPNQRFAPKRKLIILIWLFLGIVAGIGLAFGKKYWMMVQSRWKVVELERLKALEIKSTEK